MLANPQVMPGTRAMSSQFMTLSKGACSKGLRSAGGKEKIGRQKT